MGKVRKAAFWIPRITGLLLALFGIYEMINIPFNRPGIQNSTARFVFDVVFVLVVLVISWNRQLLGVVLYLVLGAYFVDRAWAHGKYWVDYVLLAGSALIVSVLFFGTWIILAITGKIKQWRESQKQKAV